MFSTVVEVASPLATRVRVCGELDATGAAEFLEAMQPLVSETQFLELDLAELTFLDSSGLGAFVSLWKGLAATNGRFRLVNLTDGVRRVLAVTNLESLFLEDEPIA